MSRGKHILLVDDAETGRIANRLILERGNHFVVTADSAEKALKELAAPRSFKFDVVIADLHMPKTNGVLLAERIKRLYSKMPVILTAWNFSEYEGVQLPVDLVLVQPYGIHDLLSGVERVAGTVTS